MTLVMNYADKFYFFPMKVPFYDNSIRFLHVEHSVKYCEQIKLSLYICVIENKAKSIYRDITSLYHYPIVKQFFFIEAHAHD